VKKFLYLAIAMLCFIPVSALAESDAQKWKELFNFDKSTGTEFAYIQIGGYDYKIPKNYFTGGGDDPACNHHAVGLVAVLPDFKGKTKDNIATIFKTTGPHNPTVDILVTQLNFPEKALHSAIKNTQAVFGKTFEMESTFVGLHVLAADPKNNGAQNIFYGEEGGQLKRVITCTQIGARINPGCEHTFILNDASIKLGYRIRFLPDWRKIEDMARAFFTQATIGKAATKKPACKNWLTKE
jgi:hypothetical protein